MWTLSAIVIDHHVLAGISVAGVILDVMGGLYLAYDLLGGCNGPLRIITRVVTYTLFFCLGYGLALGPIFGIVAGIGLGLALGLEFGSIHISANSALSSARLRPLLFGLLRGFFFGVAATLAFGWVFGVTFGLLVGIGLSGIYLLGFAPSNEYQVVSKPRFRLRAFVASGLRGLSTGASGAIAGFVAHRGIEALIFGLEVGLVVGLVSSIVSIFSPFVEWWADHLPARRLGAFGTILLLLGLVLQSVQYWAALTDVVVR